MAAEVFEVVAMRVIPEGREISAWVQQSFGGERFQADKQRFECKGRARGIGRIARADWRRREHLPDSAA